MNAALVVDVTCEGLLEAVMRVVGAERSRGSFPSVSEGKNAVPNSVIVLRSGLPHMLLLFITYSDFQLLLRHDCSQDYFSSVYGAAGCPVNVVVLGQPSGPRQAYFWEGIARLCADDALSAVLVGFAFVESMDRAADIVVAHGFKASRQQTVDDHLLRADGRRKCDPTDFHALYLDMLLEVSSVSERRAAVIAGVFPSLYRLLECIDSGILERVCVKEYGEEKRSTALDPYIAEVLSTDYNTAEAQAAVDLLTEESKNIFT